MATSTENYAAMEGLIERFDMGEFDDCYRCSGCTRLIGPGDGVFCSACDPTSQAVSEQEVDRLLHIEGPEGSVR